MIAVQREKERERERECQRTENLFFVDALIWERKLGMTKTSELESREWVYRSFNR
jgi:hypothetical protein